MGDEISLLLEIAQRTERTLERHIETEDLRLDRIVVTIDKARSDISDLQKDHAITKTQIGFFAATVSAIVAGLGTWLANLLGMRG